MIGAVVGDIAGSRFEFHNHRSKDFELFNKGCFFTDDTVMTIAIADALMNSDSDYSDLENQAVKSMQSIGRPYPGCGYGGQFGSWMYSNNPQPYYSYGNGAAMRVSSVGWIARTIEEAKDLSRKVTEVTHNHPEGIKGAEATAVSIFLARTGKSKDEIRQFIERHYYDLNFTIDEIRPYYWFNETCQETVPQAIKAFIESSSFEDAIRTAISVGGDSDTLAAITGSIAEAYYGVPEKIREAAIKYLDNRLKKALNRFESAINA